MESLQFNLWNLVHTSFLDSKIQFVTETVGIAGSGVSNNYPQQNQIAINKNQIKMKDFHTLIIQAAGRFTSTWFPKRTE